MPATDTLLFGRQDVARLLTLRECIQAVEEVFRAEGNSDGPAQSVLALHSSKGGLHVKAGLLSGKRSYLVAKLNTNFVENTPRFGLPTIQGLVVLLDGDDGRPLAVMDSIEITIKRTAAASAVAAKFLARRDAREATICGCGVQARAQIEALCAVLPLERIYLFDLDEMAGRKLARELENDSRLEVNVTHELAPAVQASDVCVTCTTARKFFLRKEDVRPGTFIAAVGADDKQKQEIDPALMASARVVADSAEQCRAFGDFHHAITAGLATAEGIYAELSAIVAGRTPGRTNDAEIFVFDSTGVAIEDAAAAVVVYEKGERENYQTNSFRFQ